MFAVPPYVFVCKPTVIENKMILPKNCKLVRVQCDQDKCVFPTKDLLSSEFIKEQNKL